MTYARVLAVLLMCPVLASAADWPQWLGPNRNASSTERIAAWKTPPKVLWRLPVGEGHSSPVVADGVVYLHSRTKGKEEEEAIAVEAGSGKILWQKSYPRGPFSSPFGVGPRATPTVAGDRLYTLGVTGILTGWDAKSGQSIWQIDVLKEFKASNLTFGVSCSPLLDGDRLLVNVGGKGASIVAFDRGSGKALWKSLDDAASYSSPIAIEEGGARQLVFLTQQGVVSLKPEDGALNWRYPFVDLLSESSTTPVRTGDLLLASSVTLGSVALKLPDKESASVQPAWKNSVLSCYFSTPVVVGDLAYLVTGSVLPPPQAMLRCVEAKTGKELWQKPKIGKYHASLMRTGDDKLLLLDDSGNLALLEPNAKEYRELSRSKICGTTWAHPALANGKFYVRDDRELICLQLD